MKGAALGDGAHPAAVLQARPGTARPAVLFASLSLALLVIDARFRYAEGLRSCARARRLSAAARRHRAGRAAASASATSSPRQSQLLRAKTRDLRAKAARASRSDAQRYEALAAENEQLRRLIGAAERLAVQRAAGRGPLRGARSVLAQA